MPDYVICDECPCLVYSYCGEYAQCNLDHTVERKKKSKYSKYYTFFSHTCELAVFVYMGGEFRPEWIK